MTLLKSALVAAMLGTAVTAMAQVDGNSVLRSPASEDPNGQVPAIGIGEGFGRIPRAPLPKLAHVRKPSGDSKLLVKFTDAAKARVQADESVRLTGDVAGGPMDSTTLDAVVAQYNLTFKPAYGRKPLEELRALELRAEFMSGKAQPDLAGFMYVESNADSLESAANALNGLPHVEHVYFEKPLRPAVMPYQDAPGAEIAAPPQTVVAPAGVATRGDDGGIAGATADCGDCDDPMTPAPECSDCFTVFPFVPFCQTGGPTPAACCDLVGDLRAYCVEVEWDAVCVAIAHLLCEIDVGADRCASLLNGSCFEAHSTAGCVDELCCNTVCILDSFCCENEWDEACVALADVNCVVPGGGATPDLTALQGYLRQTSYEDQPGGVPPGLSLPAPIFPGFGGEGMWLFDDQYLTDHPGAPIPQRYAGIYGLGRQMFEEYGVGDFVATRGRGIKVAVIEWAYYAGHEDLSVIPEPGQTMITIPEVGFPDHATACLGIINAQINGFGMNGIAPDAQAYFFPLTSVEEGPRQMAAWTSMMGALGAGDVVSCSYGGGGNLNTNGLTWTLIRMSADLGITVCIAAGNDCANLDDANDLGESGGIVVGACTPGRPHSRLTFSNHFQGEGVGNRVHIAAWGESVPTLGGSANVLFPGGNWNRSYCSNFNGTSAAAPQVAGVAACLQGLAKQFYGIALRPEQIRAAIANTGFPQSGIPNPELVGGFDEALGCAPDFDPEEGPNKIGPYPRPERAGYFILNQFNMGFDEAPLVDSVLVIRGNLVGGNVFSIKGLDNNLLSVNSLWTPRKHRPNLPPPANKVLYLATGHVADIMITGHTEEITNQLQVNSFWIPTGGDSVTYMITEMYDFTTGKWVLLTFEPASVLLLATGQTVALATAAQRFIQVATGNTVYMRQYAIGLGGPNSAFTMQWDLIDLQAFGAIGGGGAED